MNPLQKEIQSCLTRFEVSATGALTATFRFPETFIGFQGHFPQQPVLPGICKMQAALLLCARRKGAPVRLREVIRAKFMAPAFSGETLVFTGTETPGAADDFHFKVHVTRAGQPIARIDLRAHCVADEENGRSV